MTPFQVKRITWFTLKKELHKSDFLFDGGYVGARAPLLLTSKIKRNKRLGWQFHTILKSRLLSFGTNVRGANTFLKRKYNSRIWNILYDRFPSIFLTFSTNKHWWRLHAFSSFGRHTREPRLAHPQKGRLRHIRQTVSVHILELFFLRHMVYIQSLFTFKYFSFPTTHTYTQKYTRGSHAQEFLSAHHLHTGILLYTFSFYLHI